jgi:trehalose 6-phosphate phosphatase
LRLEAKRGSLALHYRQAPQLEALCLDTLRAAVEASPGLTLMRGKMVVEAKPGGASKGLAIDAFMHEAPFAGRQPVFMGDDFTDEVGFTVVQGRGGMGVKVGGGASAAWHRVESPAALRQELAQAMALKSRDKGRTDA